MDNIIQKILESKKDIVGIMEELESLYQNTLLVKKFYIGKIKEDYDSIVLITREGKTKIHLLGYLEDCSEVAEKVKLKYGEVSKIKVVKYKGVYYVFQGNYTELSEVNVRYILKSRITSVIDISVIIPDLRKKLTDEVLERIKVYTGVSNESIQYIKNIRDLGLCVEKLKYGQLKNSRGIRIKSGGNTVDVYYSDLMKYVDERSLMLVPEKELVMKDGNLYTEEELETGKYVDSLDLEDKSSRVKFISKILDIAYMLSISRKPIEHIASLVSLGKPKNKEEAEYEKSLATLFLLCDYLPIV